jgi:hypothetical protein
LDTKFDPVISVVTDVPASPSSGAIALIEGLAVDVVVVAAEVVVVDVLVAVAVTTVVIVVGAPVGTDETVTCVIFTEYTLSIIARFDVSVTELVRYP